MVVYDRIVPNEAIESLIALTVGVLIALGFDFIDNVSDEDYKVTKGTRLFQLCSPDLSPIKFSLVEEDELSKTERGDGGFGSTGLYAQANFELPKQFEALFK